MNISYILRPRSSRFLKFRGLLLQPILFSVALLATLPSLAHAEMSVGNHGAIAFGLDAGVLVDSNIDKSNNSDSDVIYSVTPKLLYRFDQGDLYIDSAFGVLIQQYQDAGEFDNESLFGELSFLYPYISETSYKFDARIGYEEKTEADSDIQALIEREELNINFRGTYFFAERYKVRSGFSYRDENVVTSGFTDTEEFRIPVDFYYSYSENLNLGGGYEYQRTSVSGENSVDSEDHAVYFAVDGNLSEAVEFDLKVGVENRVFDNDFDDQSGLFLLGQLDWAVNERLDLGVLGKSRQETTVQGRSVERFGFQLTARQQFSEKISGLAKLEYEKSDFNNNGGAESRTDDEYSISAKVDYELTPNQLSLFFETGYEDQSSNVETSEYDQLYGALGLELIY